ncbi:MAG: FAD-binding oxidoreductase [Actinobacteria bacterium]|nr:FAD-binding oxidoreductase [Actinomycetota bacterium]
MISEGAFEELLEAVGPENASREPAVLDSYAWQPTFNNRPEPWVARPEAVVMPGCTAEVQAVVRACNRHGLRFKAFSTGWGAWAGPSGEGVVQVDLRRMDRILDIDEKNMIAVVEPYAVGGQIRAEAMKVGLNTHMIAAGAGVSPLASACAAFGPGWDGTYSPRNLMGVEWVLPDGEVLRLGTAGSGLGWFCADGPGPSLRGVMRGKAGGLSGNGIFTACALKLFPWPGPPRPEVKGLFYDMELELPWNFRLYLLIFPDRESWAEATYCVCREGLDYNIMKSPIRVVPVIVAPRLTRKLARLLNLRAALSSIQHGTMLIMAAHSPWEMEYRDAALREIVLVHGGMVLDFGAIALGGTFWWSVISGAVPPMSFRAGGQMQSGLGPDDTWDTAVAWDAAGEEIKRQWIGRGGCVDDFADACVDMLWEDGTINHSEELWYYDPRNEAHVEALKGMAFDFLLTAMEQCTDQPWNIFPEQRRLISPLQGDFNRWQRELSRVFDPGSAADAWLYVGEEDMDLSGNDPRKVAELERLVKERDWKRRSGEQG